MAVHSTINIAFSAAHIHCITQHTWDVSVWTASSFSSLCDRRNTYNKIAWNNCYRPNGIISRDSFDLCSIDCHTVISVTRTAILHEMGHTCIIRIKHCNQFLYMAIPDHLKLNWQFSLPLNNNAYYHTGRWISSWKTYVEFITCIYQHKQCLLVHCNADIGIPEPEQLLAIIVTS